MPTPREYLDDLVFWLCGGPNAEAGVLLMFRVVADESQDRHGNRAMVFAGLLGNRDVWEGFWEDWDAVLKEPEFGVTCFHAADCENAAEGTEFEGWDIPKRESLQRRLLK